MNKNAIVFGDHHHDSLCVQKLDLHNSVSLAFANYDKEDIVKNNNTLYLKYKEHWDGVLFNDNDFSLHIEILNGLKNNLFN